jgi:fatty acid desaturase
MHKKHHTYTNNIDKDPELTSSFTREELENPGFRNVPLSRVAYFRQFFDVFDTFKCRAGRILNSAAGIAVDYSGTGWSLKEWSYGKDSGIMRTLQRTALAQLACDAAMFIIFGRSKQGLYGLVFWWIVPVLCGYPAVNFIRNLEHADCEVSKEPNFLLNTRSVQSNIVVRTLLWDTNFHAAHHSYPMVPFFNLQQLNDLIYPHVLHNEHDHFTTQNWAAIKAGGWIDQQAARTKAYNNKNTAKNE